MDYPQSGRGKSGKFFFNEIFITRFCPVPENCQNALSCRFKFCK